MRLKIFSKLCGSIQRNDAKGHNIEKNKHD